MTKKRVNEELLRTAGIAVVGFLALLAVLPQWARPGVAIFGMIYAVMIVVLDDDVQDALRGVLDSRLRRNDPTKEAAKSPESRRGVT